MDFSSVISNIATQLLIVIVYALRKYLKKRGCIVDGEAEEPRNQEPENRAVATVRPSSIEHNLPRGPNSTRDNKAPTHGPIQPGDGLQNQRRR